MCGANRHYHHHRQQQQQEGQQRPSIALLLRLVAAQCSSFGNNCLINPRFCPGPVLTSARKKITVATFLVGQKKNPFCHHVQRVTTFQHIFNVSFVFLASHQYDAGKKCVSFSLRLLLISLVKKKIAVFYFIIYFCQGEHNHFWRHRLPYFSRAFLRRKKIISVQ